MLQRKHWYYLISLIIVIIVGIVFYSQSRDQLGQHTPPVRERLLDKPDLLVFYDMGITAEAAMPAATSAEPFLRAGMQWSTIGSATKDMLWYEEALWVYQQGDVFTQGKNSIILNNLAYTYNELGQYENAKKTFKRTIELAPGEPEHYVALVNLMRYKLKSTSEEILAVYAEGMKRVVGAASLFINRAAYYRDIGKFEEARADIELVHKSGALSDALYKQALKEIQEARNK